MKLKKIDGKTVKGFVEWLKANDCGCCHFNVGDTDEKRIHICVGWHEVCVEDGPGEDIVVGKDVVHTFKRHDEWRIHWKIGMESFNNAMQTDLDIDFDMPYDVETGDVYDTLEEIDHGAMNESGWRKLAARMNAAAEEAYKFQDEQEHRYDIEEERSAA